MQATAQAPVVVVLGVRVFFSVGLPFLQWKDAVAEKLGFGVCGLSRPSGRWASGCRG